MPTAKPVEKPVVEKTITNPAQVEGYVLNALGEKVPLYKEYSGDYDTSNTLSNAKLSKENIEIKMNPDIQEFLKYNKQEGMGYMVYYNTKTKKEVKAGTHLPLKLLYPFQIDTINGVVSTKMEYDYPILFTEEPTPEDVKQEWANLENIYRLREEELNKKRNENIPVIEGEESDEDDIEEDEFDNDYGEDEE